MNRIDRASPIPLFHQIAQAIQNAIAVGDIAPGERLPPVRDAARAWGVNLHTVRRAYQELSRDGILQVRGSGTQVRDAPAHAVQSSLSGFLDAWVREARERFGLTPVRLGQLLLRQGAANVPPVVHFVECSRQQATGHSEELMGAWRVDARPLVLSEMADLPSGLLVSTFFHYNDIRRRWPDRLDEVRFVAISPDPSLTARLPRAATRGHRLLVCELDESKAVNIAADLRPIVPEDRLIEPRVLRSPARLPRAAVGDVLLVSPRVWGALSERQRARVIPIHYAIRAHELEAIGVRMGWERMPLKVSA